MILANIAQTVMVFSPFDPVWKVMLNIPAIALGNVMTTRVYRAFVLGYITDQTQKQPSASVSTSIATSNPNHPLVSSGFRARSAETEDIHIQGSGDKARLPGP